MEIQRQENRPVNPPLNGVVSAAVELVIDGANVVKEAVKDTFSQLKEWTTAKATIALDRFNQYMNQDLPHLVIQKEDDLLEIRLTERIS